MRFKKRSILVYIGCVCSQVSAKHHSVQTSKSTNLTRPHVNKFEPRGKPSSCLRHSQPDLMSVHPWHGTLRRCAHWILHSDNRPCCHLVTLEGQSLVSRASLLWPCNLPRAQVAFHFFDYAPFFVPATRLCIGRSNQPIRRLQQPDCMSVARQNRISWRVLEPGNTCGPTILSSFHLTQPSPGEYSIPGIRMEFIESHTNIE